MDKLQARCGLDDFDLIIRLQSDPALAIQGQKNIRIVFLHVDKQGMGKGKNHGLKILQKRTDGGQNKKIQIRIHKGPASGNRVGR